MNPTPITSLDLTGCALDLKRDDLIHNVIPGSKFRKYQSLVPYLEKSSYPEIIIYGGGRSHHVRALLRYIHEYAPTLLERPIVAALTMPNFPLSAEETFELEKLYQRPIIWNQKMCDLKVLYPEGYHILEGGFVKESLPGAMSLGNEIADAKHIYDHVYFDAGTGFSAWAAILALKQRNYQSKFYIMSMADSVEVMYQKSKCIQTWAQELGFIDVPLCMSDVEIIRPLTAKSFGVQNKTIKDFTDEFLINYDIEVHPLYSAKLLHYIKNTRHKAGRTLVVHSGIG